MLANRIRPARALMLAAVAIALVVLAGLAPSASAASVRTAVSSLPRLPAQARVLGGLSPRRRVRLTVSLRPRSAAALRRYATAVSTPGNGQYGQYLTVSEFAARFGAPRSHISAVRRALGRDGLSLGRLDRNHLTLSVSAPARTVERTFDVSLFALRLGSRSGFANRSEATLPRSIARDVQAVSGFDDVTLENAIRPLRPSGTARPAASAGSADTGPDPGPVERPQIADQGGPQPCAAATAQQQTARAADTPGPLTADDLALANRFDNMYRDGSFGQGQTVGLIEDEPLSRSDLTAFDSCYKISPTVNATNVGGGPPASATDSESALDVEVVAEMAPRSTIDVYQGSPQVSAQPALWSTAISADSAQVLSASLGACEAQVPVSVSSAENTLFQEAATQGQTVLAAAGDSGSAGCAQSTPSNTSLSVDDPASQPFVTGVGGTTFFSLTLNAAGTACTGSARFFDPTTNANRDCGVNAVWNDGVTSAGPAAGGGGISSRWAMPSYQSSAPKIAGVVNSDSSGAPCKAAAGHFCREVPDVSADADPTSGYVVFAGGKWQVIGGTSGATPLWASWVTLTNGLPSCRGARVGFANPLLYSLTDDTTAGPPADPLTDTNAEDDGDITADEVNPFTAAASNDALGVNGGLYPLTNGYDMATGLGTFLSLDGANHLPLNEALCEARSPVYKVTWDEIPTNQLLGVGQKVSLRVRATDAGGLPLTYTATGLPAGLSMSPDGEITGTVAPIPSETPTVFTNTKIDAKDRFGNEAAVTISFSVELRVLLALPESQRTTVGRRVSVRIISQDLGHNPVSVTASGLPAGLHLSPSGLITGRPRTVGRSTVTVRADAADGSATGKFSWSVVRAGGKRAARVTKAKLTGLGKRKPRLVLVLTANRGSPGIRSVSTTVPKGLALAAAAKRVRKGTKVAVAKHGKLATLRPAKLSERARARTLTVRLKRAAGTVRITVDRPELTDTRSEARRARRHRPKRLILRLLVASAKHRTSRLSVAVKPRS